jgi:hypothetical protein
MDTDILHAGAELPGISKPTTTDYTKNFRLGEPSVFIRG